MKRLNQIFKYSFILFAIVICQTVYAKEYKSDSTFLFETSLVQPPSNTMMPMPEKGYQTADLVAITIYINNPSKNPIISSRFWFNFPKDKVEGVEILKDSDFNLDTPNELNIDQENGLVKIGKGVTNKELTGTKIKFATIVFRILSETPNDIVTLSPFGYTTDNSTKVTINVVDDYLPIRVLPKDTGPKPFSFKVNLIDGGNSGSSELPPEETTTNTTGTFKSPYDVIACSEGSEVTFTWKLPEDEVDGFYIYYSPESGNYIQRKTLPKIQAYSFTDFAVGATQYFKFSSYKGGVEGVKSDEFKVTIGALPCQPVFSDLSNLIVVDTSNTSDIGTTDIIKGDKTPDTGPNIIVLLIASVALTLTFGGLFTVLRPQEY